MKLNPVVTFGEIMMRLSTPRHERFEQAKSFNALYGGSEANVAVSLAGFNIPSAHVTRLPHNDLGKSATQFLRQHGVDTTNIIYGPERMGLYFLENGAMQRSSRIVYDRFDSAFAHVERGHVKWSEIMKKASWFHWSGITPAISLGAAEVLLEALTAAKHNKVTVSGDINYRRNLWQYGKSAIDVMPELISMTDHVIAGAEDIHNCTGIEGSSFEDACRKLCAHSPNVQTISCTERESISASQNKIRAVMFSGGDFIWSKGYDLSAIVDRVGSGDAFVAGLIYSWLANKNDREIIEFATAACAWKHSIEGDANLVSVEEIQSLVKGENVGKLLR